jgi:hypothetical protein
MLHSSGLDKATLVISAATATAKSPDLDWNQVLLFASICAPDLVLAGSDLDETRDEDGSNRIQLLLSVRLFPNYVMEVRIPPSKFTCA